MLPKLLASLLLITAVQTACAGGSDCDHAARRAEADSVLLVPRVDFTVTGEGRLYFHSAPDKDCKLQETFVIAGDHLVGYSEIAGWTSVMYITSAGDPVQGWVRSERLRRAGTLGIVQ